MTECKGGPAQEMAESYLMGGLTEVETERFEDHYFGCVVCSDYVAALQEIREGLIREPLVIADAGLQKQARGRLLGFKQRWMMLGAIAAGLVVAVVLFGVSARRGIDSGSVASGGGAAAKPVVADSAPAGDGVAKPVDVASLADVQLPGYHPPQLRGAEDAGDASEAAFKAGMKSYVRGDCAGALKSLRKVPAAGDRAGAATLYSGLCAMTAGTAEDLARAQADFGKVVAAGDSAELETAEFYMAQALLLQGDVSGARSWLTKTIALQGDYEERARRQKARLAGAGAAGGN